MPGHSIRRCSIWRSFSFCSAMEPRSGWRRCTLGCDAHAEGPTPISAVLSGLLLNVALYAVLRFKILLTANGAALAPGLLMIALGLGSLVFAALMLYRRRDIKRMFAYSSIEHMGIITFAFGMGGPLASFAGLLHMAMHSLTKSAIFFAVGHIAQVKGTQKIAEIRGLTESHPLLGWALVIGVIAIAGMPPFGIFMSEFLIITSTFAREPMLAIVLVTGLLIGIGALVLRVQSIAFGEPSESHGTEIRHRWAELVTIYDNTASLQDRTVGAGILRPEFAALCSCGGFVGRASGRAVDARRRPGYPPYDELSFEIPVRHEGDVDARVWVRISEVEQSLGLIQQILNGAPAGPVRTEFQPGHSRASREGMA